MTLSTMLDYSFLAVTLLVLVFVLVGSRWLSRVAYNRMLLLCFFLSVAIIVLFNEYEVELQGNSPLHSALMALCQYGALTLSAKVWFSINYPKFPRFLKIVINLAMYGGLIGLVIANYVIKTGSPLLVILLYPLGSVSLALVAETIEESLHTKS